MKLIIRFTDKSESFTNGVEFGRILRMMEAGEPVVSNYKFPIHSDNENVIIQACAEYGYTPTIAPCKFGGWVNFSAIKSELNN